MNPSDIISELKNARKNPALFACSLILIILLVSGVSWLTGFWGKKGEQFAESAPEKNIQLNSGEAKSLLMPTEGISEQTRNATSQGTKKFAYNKNFMSRDKIIGIKVDWGKEKSGIVRFDSIDFSSLNKLLKQKFINPMDKHNASPTAGKIYDFLEVHKEIKAMGYAVSPYREDYRVTLDGVILKKEDITKDLKIAFFEFCKNADELDTIDDLYCWWD